MSIIFVSGGDYPPIDKIIMVNNKAFKITGWFVFGLLALIALSATLIPLLSSKAWYVRIFDYPRLQTFFISVMALAWYGIFYFKKKRWPLIFVGIFLMVIVVQAYKAFPYTPLASKQVKWSSENSSDSNSISFLISNVLQENSSYGLLLKKVAAENPDVIITTESDSAWQNALISLHDEYNYRVPVPLQNTYGMHLYSRLPLSGTEVRFLLEPDIPSIRTKIQLRSGEMVSLFIVHPRPPIPGEDDDSRERDAEILMIGKEAKKENGAGIVAGDFNDVAWSETTELFQELTGYLDPRRGRGFYNTYHAKYPVFRWPLDHIFHSNHFTLSRMERLGSVNSDHFPMYVKLQFDPERRGEQPVPLPDKDTKEKTEKTIRKGKEDAGKPPGE